MRFNKLVFASLVSTAISICVPSHAATLSVYEFYNKTLNHYFRTASAAEATGIDNGAAGAGWARTGDDFLAYDSAGAPAGTQAVCRFYGSVSPGPNSHFYTASVAECAQLKVLEASTPATQKRWNYEGLAFTVSLPGAAGCAAGTTPIYRLYNKGFESGADSNHRYTTQSAEVDRLKTAGWSAEGVVMCSAPSTTPGAAQCPQAQNFPNVSARSSYIDKDLDGKSYWELDGSAAPATSVTCASGQVSVVSNGLPNFDPIGIGRGGANARYQTNTRTWKFPQTPAKASQPTSLRNVLGPIAVMINGVQIFGPVEAPVDNFADPFLAGLLNYCGGHVDQYHYHAFPECFFNQKTLDSAGTFLPAKTPGVVIGYAFDGFPILSPYEACTETGADCVNGVKEIKSSYRYRGTGSFTTEAAFDANVYEAGYLGSTLDACNGKTGANGQYAYYATRQFPYYLGCYAGTKTAQ